MLLESVSLAVSVITQCYFTGALLVMVRSWREELLYNILIKCQYLGYEDLQKHFLALFFFPFFPLFEVGRLGDGDVVKFSYCPFPRSNTALISKATLLEG